MVARKRPTERQKAYAWARFGGCCARRWSPLCKGDLAGAKFEWDHDLELALGGDNSDDQWGPCCVPCHKVKSAARLKMTRKADRQAGRKGQWALRKKHGAKLKGGKKLEGKGFEFSRGLSTGVVKKLKRRKKRTEQERGDDMTENAVVPLEPRRSVTADMATRFGMEVQAFEQVMRATVIPGNCTKEQFAAFLLVAKQYGLNPLTREIFAFPVKGGGIFPVVSIDGWIRIINEQPAMDGLTFEDHREEGKIVAVTAKVHRKDRAYPVEVTEYMSECVRATDTWKQWPARMLRHKATIQAARYAFGFAGIYDIDEAERMPAGSGIGGEGQMASGAKTSSQAKKDKDDVWVERQIKELRTEEDAAQLRQSDRWLGLPMKWREGYEDTITAHLDEVKFQTFQRENDITAADLEDGQ